jgi:hypothetical protein
MLRRLFQCFKKSIEGGSTQHVNLVDDIHFVFSKLWREPNLIHEIADIFHGVIARGIQFIHVERRSGIEGYTGFTCVTRLSVGGYLKAVDRLSKNPRAGGFTNTTRSAKQISLR